MITYSRDQKSFVAEHENKACFSIGITSGSKPGQTGSLQLHMDKGRAGVLWEMFTLMAMDQETSVVDMFRNLANQLEEKGVKL